ncbi:hypothetical protein [uncultured Tateyamaria sp.]|uniref:hypothetical protein n=1 Tax=Tateyamaria sp. 1078 TaxID=3417464 RepID=UPI00261ABD0B|nr:hypothetical protein [uncultured Tateyamaria sp.]
MYWISFRRVHRLGVLLWMCATVFLAGGANGQSAVANDQLCKSAAHVAAKKTGVPTAVLLKILHPAADHDVHAGWPWSVTMAGEATIQFATNDAALAYVYARFLRGARQFSVGCFGIRYEKQSDTFLTIDAMFDPTQNAAHAASLLQRLHKISGTWDAALAAFQSRTFSVASTGEPQRGKSHLPAKPIAMASMVHRGHES